MTTNTEIYHKLRTEFVHQQYWPDNVKLGDYYIYCFRSDKLKKLGGTDYQNLACFVVDQLIWVSDFPQINSYAGGYVGGVWIIDDDSTHVRAQDFGGAIYRVEVATGKFEKIGWSK